MQQKYDTLGQANLSSITKKQLHSTTLKFYQRLFKLLQNLKQIYRLSENFVWHQKNYSDSSAEVLEYVFTDKLLTRTIITLWLFTSSQFQLVCGQQKAHTRRHILTHKYCASLHTYCYFFSSCIICLMAYPRISDANYKPLKQIHFAARSKESNSSCLLSTAFSLALCGSMLAEAMRASTRMPNEPQQNRVTNKQLDLAAEPLIMQLHVSEFAHIIRVGGSSNCHQIPGF